MVKEKIERKIKGTGECADDQLFISVGHMSKRVLETEEE